MARRLAQALPLRSNRRQERKGQALFLLAREGKTIVRYADLLVSMSSSAAIVMTKKTKICLLTFQIR